MGASADLVFLTDKMLFKIFNFTKLINILLPW